MSRVLHDGCLALMLGGPRFAADDRVGPDFRGIPGNAEL